LFFLLISHKAAWKLEFAWSSLGLNNSLCLTGDFDADGWSRLPSLLIGLITGVKEHFSVGVLFIVPRTLNCAV